MTTRCSDTVLQGGLVMAKSGTRDVETISTDTITAALLVSKAIEFGEKN